MSIKRLECIRNRNIDRIIVTVRDRNARNSIDKTIDEIGAGNIKRSYIDNVRHIPQLSASDYLFPLKYSGKYVCLDDLVEKKEIHCRQELMM